MGVLGSSSYLLPSVVQPNAARMLLSGYLLSSSSNPACAEIFPGSGHISDLKIGTSVATLPGAWLYGVSAGTGRKIV